MRIVREPRGASVAFQLLEIEPELAPAARAKGFQPIDGGFEQVYPATHPQLDRIFAQFARHAPAMLRQKAGLEPVPWEDALLAVVEATAGASVGWWLTGSAALAVRGLAVSPGDIDLIVDGDSADRFEALMIGSVIEPPRPGFISDTFTRGFNRACIEWIAGVDERADRHMVGDVGLVAASRLETVAWRGHEMRVPPLDLQLAVSEARGLVQRAALIRRVLETDPEPGAASQGRPVRRVGGIIPAAHRAGTGPPTPPKESP